MPDQCGGEVRRRRQRGVQESRTGRWNVKVMTFASFSEFYMYKLGSGSALSLYCSVNAKSKSCMICPLQHMRCVLTNAHV